MKALINKNSGIPLYYQIKEIIKEKIDNGELKSGDKIPNELELAETFEVSRSTVRQAISGLVSDGILNRKKGVGTFVSKPKFEGNFINLSYPEELGSKHIPIQAKVKVAASNHLKALNLENEEKVYEIIRIRLFNEEPAVIERTYIPVKLVPNLLEENLEGKLYELMEDKYGISMTGFKNYIEPVLLDDYESKLLEVDKDQPALKITKLIMSPQGEPVMLSFATFRGDRCRLLFSSD